MHQLLPILRHISTWEKVRDLILIGLFFNDIDSIHIDWNMYIDIAIVWRFDWRKFLDPWSQYWMHHNHSPLNQIKWLLDNDYQYTFDLLLLNFCWLSRLLINIWPTFVEFLATEQTTTKYLTYFCWISADWADQCLDFCILLLSNTAAYCLTYSRI